MLDTTTTSVRDNLSVVTLFLLLFALIHPNSRTLGALCTPSDPDFIAQRYQIAICRRHVPKSLRATVASSYGVPRASWGAYELDHLVPLAIGGSNAPSNLWMQPLAEALAKDVVEEEQYLLLRAGKVTQAEAVDAVLHWWR